MDRADESGEGTSEVVLYGGKGGVGKTTCAAAHALARSEAEPAEKTLVVSTDPAHSLGDAFERTLGDEPVAVTDSLFAVEVGADRGQQAYRTVVEALAAEFNDAGLGIDDGDLERLFEAGLIPGGDEVAALEYIARYTDGEYDAVVFDTAPTGHTLRLLDLPEVLGETFAVAGEIRQRVRRAARTARSMVMGPAAYWSSSDDDGIEPLRERIAAVEELLHDPERTSFRVVLTPERMAIAETERLVARLEAAAVPVDSLVLNRRFGNEQECSCDRCRRDAERHAERSREINDTFELPVSTVPELQTEAHGLDALSAVGRSLVSTDGTQ